MYSIINSFQEKVERGFGKGLLLGTTTQYSWTFINIKMYSMSIYFGEVFKSCHYYVLTDRWAKFSGNGEMTLKSRELKLIL